MGNTMDRLKSLIHGEPELFLEGLLLVAESDTYDHIRNCPRYPTPAKSDEGLEVAELLERKLSGAPDDGPNVLARAADWIYDKESRKKEGIYFTPEEIIGDIFSRLIEEQNEILLDVGAGTGILGSSWAKQYNKSRVYFGIENNPILCLACSLGFSRANFDMDWSIWYNNFLTISTEELWDKLGQHNIRTDEEIRLVSNPPYIRFQLIDQDEAIRTSFKEKLGISLDGYSGVHGLFLCKSFEIIQETDWNWASTGRAIFLLPSEFGRTQYGSVILDRISQDMDVSDIPAKSLPKPNDGQLPQGSISSVILWSDKSAEFDQMNNASPIESQSNHDGIPLGELIDIHRGISTGANDYFTLSEPMRKDASIDEEFLTKIVPTQNPLKGEIVSEANWEEWKRDGKKVWLLSISSSADKSDLPPGVRNYIRKGEKEGINQRATCRRRKAWYSVPLRDTPEFFFTYVSQGSPRFLVNQGDLRYLTNLLGGFLRDKYSIPNANKRLKFVQLLNNELEIAISEDRVGRHYVRGLFKAEPGELESVKVSIDLIKHLNGRDSRIDEY